MDKPDMPFPTGGLLNIGDLLRVVKISRALVYKLLDQKKFPRPIKLGSRSFWKRSDIDKWIEKQQPPKA